MLEEYKEKKAPFLKERKKIRLTWLPNKPKANEITLSKYFKQIIINLKFYT